MPEPTGYILRLTDDRLDRLRQQLMYGESFAEPVKEFAHSRAIPLVCFVLDSAGDLQFVASGARGYSAGTDYRRLNLSELYEVSPSRPLDEIAELLAGAYRKRVLYRIESGGLLTPKQFRALVDRIVATDVALGERLKRYATSRLQRIQALSDPARQQLAYEREAVATAFHLAGIDRGLLLEWDPPTHGAPKSFLEGLHEVYSREDAQIANDSMVFPEFSFAGTSIAGRASFENEEGVRLTVLIGNRAALEELTGADLIYYNETFRAFVMVQYKAMEQEQREPIFRPDEQLHREVARMDEFVNRIQNAAEQKNPDDFRLTWNPFFLKLCPRVAFVPDTESLWHGMYIPLDKWRLLAGSKDLLGERGGVGATFTNVRRYLDNTTFAMLVSEAWVGTTPAQSTTIVDLIRATIEAGRAAVVAFRSGPSQTRVASRIRR